MRYALPRCISTVLMVTKRAWAIWGLVAPVGLDPTPELLHEGQESIDALVRTAA